MTTEGNPIKVYAKLLGKIPQVLRMTRQGTSDSEQENFDAEHIAPLHEQLGHEQQN